MRLTWIAATLLVASCAGLAGCVSMPKADKLTDPPSRTFASSKPVATVADCIERSWPTSTTVVSGEPLKVERLSAPAGARKLLLKLGTIPDHQALVEPEGRGSRTGTWTLGTYFGDTPGQVRAVAACQ